MDERKVGSLIPHEDPTRAARLRWWHEARLGLFIHFGPYAVLGRGEWAMQQEHIRPEEYTPLGHQLTITPETVRGWVRLAAESGMRYAVLTCKHCDGFHLWASSQTEFNAVQASPGFDIVAVFVAACREFGLRIGMYYCLMDWRHPDGDRCAIDEDARRRFVDYTHANVRELMANYGTIDVLWFDGPWPMPSAAQWESQRLIATVRALQPNIVINNRARVAEDFSTPEGEVTPAGGGRSWEACMTTNGDWGYSDTPEGDWRSTRDILRMLRIATAFNGNLLLNVGPRADGSIPELALDRLRAVGLWLQAHGEAVYGAVTPVAGQLEAWLNSGYWTLKGNVGYFWLLRGRVTGSFSLARVETPVLAITELATGRPLRFTQEADRLWIEGVESNAEPVASCPVLKVEFSGPPRQQIGAGMIPLPDDKVAWW